VPAKKSSGNSTFAALKTVHKALLPLTADQRARVLDSVMTLLETAAPSVQAIARPAATAAAAASPLSSTRRASVVEVLNERKPVTIPGKLTLFAYYREKYEGLSRFSRNDLEAYFSKAKEKPPTHFGREFDGAVKKGWLHEDGAESYITSRGIEEVEANFPNERKWTKSTKKAKKTKAPASS